MALPIIGGMTLAGFTCFPVPVFYFALREIGVGPKEIIERQGDTGN